MQDATNKALDKIKKLLALAERAGTPEEAGTAFATAQRLMTAHAISEAQVRAAATLAGYQADEPIVARIVWSRTGSQIPTWIFVVVNAVAVSNGCSPLCCSGRAAVKAWGAASGLDATETLIGPITGQIDALAKCSGLSGRTALNNFRLGAAQVVAARLQRARAAALAETRALAESAPHVEAEITALALRSVEGALKAATSRMHVDVPGIRKVSSSSSYDADARAAGQAAGARVNLSASKGLRS